MPIPRPAATVMPNEVKPPSSAAPRAGTMRSGTLIGSSVVIGETMIPNRPTMTVASTQLAPARKSGEKPRTMAPFSFSAAARVARPNRVNRNSA